MKPGAEERITAHVLFVLAVVCVRPPTTWLFVFLGGCWLVLGAVYLRRARDA